MPYAASYIIGAPQMLHNTNIKFSICLLFDVSHSNERMNKGAFANSKGYQNIRCKAVLRSKQGRWRSLLSLLISNGLICDL